MTVITFGKKDTYHPRLKKNGDAQEELSPDKIPPVRAENFVADKVHFR
jgi:hypothetical protein